MWFWMASQFRNCTEVRFASFFSGGFISVIVVNPPERRLAKRTFVDWINSNAMQQSNRQRQTLYSRKSWISLLQDLAPWSFSQNSLFHSDLIAARFFSNTRQSHIETKPAEWEIGFQASIFQWSWILYSWVRQLSCTH